jgi:hypothetical protein
MQKWVSFISKHSQTVISTLSLFWDNLFLCCFSGPNKWHSGGKVKNCRFDCPDFQSELTATNLVSVVVVWVCVVVPKDQTSRHVQVSSCVYVDFCTSKHESKVDGSFCIPWYRCRNFQSKLTHSRTLFVFQRNWVFQLHSSLFCCRSEVLHPGLIVIVNSKISFPSFF